MTSIRWAHAARDDLERIRRYLRARNPDAARKVVIAVQAQCLRLRTFPLSAPLADQLGLRKLSVQGLPYIILYAIVEGRVEIVRVRHTSEDWRP